MKTNSIRSLLAPCALALFVATCPPVQSAPVGTAFTYQGRLNADGGTANGPHDFEFRLIAAETNGAALAGPVSLLSVPVSNGLFQAAIDFGPGAFNGEARWLHIAVKNSFTDDLPHPLSPRQPITATPYALHAANAGGLMSIAHAPLDIKINGERVMRYEPATSPTLGFMPNLIGGVGSYVTTQNHGVTVAGGGHHDVEDESYFSTVSGGLSNWLAHGTVFSVIAGGEGNQIANGSHAVIGGGAFNRMWVWGVDPFTPKIRLYDVIGGGVSNVLGGATMSTIGGGAFNRLDGEIGNPVFGATIGGGIGNIMEAGEYGVYESAIAGGSRNAIRVANYATIGGGRENSIDVEAEHGVIGGGGKNEIGPSSENTTISGGFSNRVSPGVTGGTIGGGLGNLVGPYSSGHTISGGGGNSTGWEISFATISGGESNQVNGSFGTVSGGAGNLISTNTLNATIGGGTGNEIQTANGNRVGNSTISGGGTNVIAGAEHASIGGGRSNVIQWQSSGAVIGGGEANRINTYNLYSTISGGTSNGLGYFSYGSTIGGGVQNGTGEFAHHATIAGGAGNNTAYSEGATLSGGFGNLIGGRTRSCTISGGISNQIPSDSYFSTIGGGLRNRIKDYTPGAVIAGGAANIVDRLALYAVVSGGEANQANGPYSTVAGGRLNIAGGTNSFAAGYRAQATNDGTFVWADSEDADFSSTGANQFLIRASGGVGINTDSPEFALHVNGDAGKPGGGAWSVASDARLKKDIRPLEQALARLLQLHGVTYEYKDPKAIHELPGQQTGMIAQEVEKVFPDWVETAPDGMRRLSIRGFEALTVEALRELRTEKDDQIRSRDEQIAAMEKRLTALEEKLASGGGK